MAFVFSYGTKASAIGTPAGTSISNQAYVDFEDANGNTMTRVYSNTVTVTVSQVAGVEFSPDTDTQVGANNTDAYFFIDLINNGNATDTFTVTPSTNPASDWTPTDIKFFVDNGTIGVFETGIDIEVASPYTVSNLGANLHAHGIIVISIPDAVTALDGDSTITNLTAVSSYDGTATDIGAYTTTVTAAVLSVLKSTSPSDPQPGDTVTYTITLTNNGSTDATNVIVTDNIPTNTTFKASSITLDTVSKTDASDADEADYNVTSAGAVTVEAGTISSGGGSSVITFQVTVDESVLSGTTVQNTASINFDSGPNNVTIASNGSDFTVATLADVDISATTSVTSGDPGDQIIYNFSVTNNGNAADIIDITYASSEGFSWAVWVDVDGNGTPGTGSDYLLTDSNGNGKIDTGSLLSGASLSNLLLVTTIPAGTPDSTTDTTVVTASSNNDNTVTDTQTFTTTVTAPVVSITKSVSPTGSQPPTTVLTYTITVTNNGTGVATSVIVTDPIPANTTYSAGTIETGSVLGSLTSRTDANDGDPGYYNSGSDDIECGSVGSAVVNIGPGSSWYCRFKVTID